MKLSNENEKSLENFNFLKYYLYVLLIALMLIVGCAAKEQPTPKEPSQLPKEEKPIEPTPVVEEAPVAEQSEEKIKIPPSIQIVLEKAKTKLMSYSYNYKSPGVNEAYKVYIKGNMIKIMPPEIVNVEEGKFYNTIYINTENKTAEAYCVGYSDCMANVGKIKDLNYGDAYFKTPLDWIDDITEAEKVDERTVEGRKALLLKTNIGEVIVSSYNGFIYSIKDGNRKWEFSDAAFDSVTNADVMPS